MLFLTIKEAAKILTAIKNPEVNEVEVSLDINLTWSKVRIDRNSRTLLFGDKEVHKPIPFRDLEKVKEDTFYFPRDGKLNKVAIFSDETNFYYKLLPSPDWPTIALSSTQMHRRTHISPRKDTKLKIKEISPVKGNVLDTCCGLGYTAIMSSKFANHVYTFERDNNVLEIARINPHSQELFNSPKITIAQKDVSDGILTFNDLFFDRIIHDPPTFKYSPYLYSGEFYSQLFRVLKRGGILYHYSPAPQKTHNASFHTGLVKRLKNAGFKHVEYHESSSGIRAIKQ